MFLRDGGQRADALRRGGEPALVTRDQAGGDQSFRDPGHRRAGDAAPAALIYLAVADVRAETDRLRARGVTIDTEPHLIFKDDDGTFGPDGEQEWMAFICDSEGNLVGLVAATRTGAKAARSAA